MSFDLSTDDDLRTGTVTGLKVVYLTGPQSVGIQRVLLNGRSGEEGCDFVREDIVKARVKACLDGVQQSHGPEAVAAAVAEAEKKVQDIKEYCRKYSASDSYGTPLHVYLPPDDDRVKACFGDWLQHYNGYLYGPMSPGGMARSSDEEERSAAKELEEGSAECKSGSNDQPWPQTLKLGDALTINVSCGERTVSAKIFTDDGREATYQIR